MNEPKTVSELYPSKYLVADDLKGKAFVVTVERVSTEKMRDAFTHQDEWKAVLHFRNAQKGLVLNKTQAMIIRDLAGSEVLQDWVGVKIVLAPGYAKNGKKTITIRAPGEMAG